MTTLLRIDASARTDGSHSRALADELEAAWLQANPTGKIVRRDLARDPVPAIHNDTIAGYYTAPEQMTETLRQATALSDKLIKELLSADTLLIATPMYNFSIPAVLKAWIDQIVRINRTFSYDPASGFDGLIKNKTAYVITASGAQFTGTPLVGYDFLRPYLNALLSFIGYTQVRFYSVESTTTDEQQLQQTKQAALQEIRREFAKREMVSSLYR